MKSNNRLAINEGWKCTRTKACKMLTFLALGIMQDSKVLLLQSEDMFVLRLVGMQS